MTIDPQCCENVDEVTAKTADDGEKNLQLLNEPDSSCCCHPENQIPTDNPLFALHDDSSSEEFYCPMCPDVVSGQPGNCPKCGMALLRKNLSAEEAPDAELKSMRLRLYVSLIFGIPVFLISMGPMFGIPIDTWIGVETSRWLQFALSTPVLFWAGGIFFQRAWQSVISRRFNMFTLIAIGTGTAYLYSAIAMLAPHLFPASMLQNGYIDLYFEAAVTITALILLGQVLELISHRKTGSAIRELISLAPDKAIVLRNDSEIEIPVGTIQVGDHIRVRPGERIPADGIVTEGNTSINESMITGESIPVSKKLGDRLTGGTVNETGSIIFQADRVGRETVLARIVNLVADAQKSRAPIQRLADIVAGWFVPVVVLISILTFFSWMTVGPEPRLAYAVVCAVAVLIIACPCALGLATPLSIMVGVGRAAKEGVLFRNAESLQQLEHVDTIVIDKTGTLTQGYPEVTQVRSISPFDDEQLIQIAASVEKQSEHPLATAVVSKTESLKLNLEDVTNFHSHTGQGIEAKIDGCLVRVGRLQWLAESGITFPEEVIRNARDWQHNAETVVFVSADDTPAGIIAIADPIKENSIEAIQKLKSFGLNIRMLTGDSEDTATAVARKLSIETIEANVRPEEKQLHIQRLKDAGHIVAMVGDGINDAPALAEANVGIAMSTGTDVAMESAGVTLVGGDLNGIVRAVTLSRKVMWNIRQNLFFAFGYNAISIPVAAGVLWSTFGILLNPMIAAAAMVFSDISIVGNALRLRSTNLSS